MKKSIFNFIFIIKVSLLYSAYANAICTHYEYYSGSTTSTLPERTYVLQYDDSSTRILDTLSVFSVPNGKRVGIIGDNCLSQYSIEYLGYWSSRPVTNNIITTNIPGISMRISLINIHGALVNFAPSKNNLQRWSDVITGTNWKVEIIKSAEVHQAGSLNSGPLVQYIQRSSTPPLSSLLSTANIKENSIKIKIINCSIKQSSYDINMGDWYDRQFNNIGDSSSQVDIPIKLSCMQGSNIKATVSANNIVDNATGKIGLVGDNKATGIAIQLLDKNSQPISLNIQKTLQDNVSEGDYIFGWKARYIKTDTNITPGTANATATVNVRYE